MSTGKLLILTERFYPEEFLINDLAAEWVARNWKVEVLTQVPSYPHDRIFDSYRNLLFQTTNEWNGIPVHRVRTLLGYNRSVVRKIFNYLNFALLTSLWCLVHGWKYERVFIYHTGPLTMANAAVILHYFCRKKCVIWTQDIWPDAVYAYGFKPALWKKLLLDSYVRLIYSCCSTIGISSPGFKERLRPYTGKEIHYFPQWTQQDISLPLKKPTGKMVFTFAGNIGSVQNLELVLEAFGSLQTDAAELRLVGGGVHLERLVQLVRKKQWRNIVFTGRLPRERMPEIFQESDVLLLSLKPEFSLTVPAKFQAYLAAGRPIFGIITGDTARMIQAYEFGIAVSPELASVRQGFLDFLLQKPERFKQWSQNAQELSQTLFKRENIIQQLNQYCQPSA